MKAFLFVQMQKKNLDTFFGQIPPQFLKRVKLTPIVFLARLRIGHKYLHYDSCHEEYFKRPIVFSKTLRLRKKCREKNDLDSNVENLKEECFRKSGYPEQFIKEQVARALQSASNNSSTDSKREKGTMFHYNHGHNILRIFDVLPNFPFTTGETKPDY